MKEVAPGVWHINAFPLPNAVNCFVIDDVLIDAGARNSGKRILKSLGDHTIHAHALTHAHADHQGASKEMCDHFGVPYWVGTHDIDAAENPALIAERQPDHPISRFFSKRFTGPGRKVDKELKEGDTVAGFKVIETPGHSAGHVVFWRDSDKVLVIGDVLNNMDVLTGIPGLREPKKYLTPDPETNRASIRKLGPLRPELVVFGHGGPLRDPDKFEKFAASV